MKCEPDPIRYSDVLVIGGGGSGVLAAVEASQDKALKVLLVCKGPVGMSGLTPTANGGTAGAGSPEDLFKWMITAGRYLNDQDIAWFMVNEVKPCLKKLNELGVPVVPLRARSVCVPGVEALRKLRERIAKSTNIELLEDVLVTSLLTTDGAVSGATALDLRTGDFFAIQAKSVVLATGGSTGELYPHTTNNPFGVTTDASGTGHVMAYQAGAELVDMEMIQFLPLPVIPRGLHIRYFPEFWTGPYLNRFGEAVESDVARYPGESYSYQLARILFTEIQKGNGPIYVDKRSVPQIDTKLLIKRWQLRRRLIKKIDIDPLDHKIELTLGSHFSMGGVRVNEKTETTLRGLYAPGEIMGGVHGAVRLSGYSFSQMIVFGIEAGKQAALYASGRISPARAPQEGLDEEKDRIVRFLRPQGYSLSVGALKKRIKETMEQYAFVARDKAGLKEGLKQVRAIRDEIPRISVPDFKTFNLEWIRAIELPSIVQAAEMVLVSALAREESRGFHYRIDFPQEDNNRWLRHTVVRRGKDGPMVDTAPVNLTRVRPEV
jgi:succinate dehydrogenase/fumarate reductase flavoprotein subunit